MTAKSNTSSTSPTSIGGDRTTAVVTISLIVGVVVLIGLILALTLIPAQVLTTTISTQVGIEQEQLGSSLSHQMELLFNATANDLLALTERPEIQEISASTRLAALKRLDTLGTARTGEFKAIVRLRADGTPVYAWPDALNQLVASNQPLEWTVDADWMKQFAQASGVQFIERSTPTGVVYLMAAPIPLADGTIEAIVFQLDIQNYFQANFATLTLSNTTQIWLFDVQGKNLYQRQPSPNWDTTAADILTVRDVQIFSNFPTDDRESVVAPVYTAFTQDRTRTPTLVLVISRIITEGQTEVRNTLNLLLFVGIGVVLFVMVLAVLVVRFILGESRRRSTVRTLLEMSRVLNSSLDLPIVLNQILTQLAELLPHDSASIMLLDEDADPPLVHVAALRGTLGVDTSMPQYPLERLKAASTVVTTARPVLVNDTANNADWVQSEASQSVHAWMGVPLRARDKVIGILNINSGQANRFRPNEADLARAFADQASVAIQNARAFELQLHQYEVELETARAIQNSLLPSEVPPFPQLEIAVRSLPAQHVSGDYYQYLVLPDGRLGVAVGDVSGKGISAALLMAVISTALREEAFRYLSSAAILDNLNVSLLKRMQATHMNSALIVGLFDPKTRHVELANGGMVQPYVRMGRNWQEVPVGGYPVGASERTHYTSKTLTLAPGAMLLFFSDGVIEARNASGELFGFERMEALLNSLPEDISSEALVDRILEEVDLHRGKLEIQDDITVLVMKSI